MEVIRTSSPANRKILKVLFYGQSITSGSWHRRVIDHWHETYPNTVFVVENRALGGFDSSSLVRTAQRDVVSFYPDLIVFHVYGDHRAYEKIIQLFRSQTTADVILQSDHGEVLPDPPCAEGLRLTLQRPAGCLGVLWLRQRLWSDEMAYHKLPAIAKKYSVALEPQRGWWRDYFLRTHVEPGSLLLDEIHPNSRGEELIANFFNRYFDNLVSRSHEYVEKEVVTIPRNSQSSADGATTVRFDGSRLELIADKPLESWPVVTIDAGQPSNVDGCYQVSRASSIDSVPDWPALRRISLAHDHTAETWTATITKMSPDQKKFEYQVKGSVSGEQGTGLSGRDFVSKSGQLQIDASDWMMQDAFDLKHVALPIPFEVRWTVDYACGGGDPEVIDQGNGRAQYRYILGTGLANSSHLVNLSWRSDDTRVTEFRAYQPPLRQ